MLTPRTSVPVVGVEAVNAAIGSGVVCGVVLPVEDPAERPQRDVALARRDVVDVEVAEPLLGVDELGREQDHRADAVAVASRR